MCIRDRTYSVVTDLFTKDYADVVKDLLPENIPFYLFSYPRITDRGVSFFYNVPQDSANGQRAPTSKEYALTFDQLRSVMRTDSECYKALNGNAIGSLDQYTGCLLYTSSAFWCCSHWCKRMARCCAWRAPVWAA